MSRPELPSTDPLPTQVEGEPATCESHGIDTGSAPPFCAPVTPPRTPTFTLPEVGQVIDDFELLRELGEGSFAKVFLARQRSLGRLVALKVSRNRGQEGRTLASLEHEHIVRVFSETVETRHDLRLMCMQYVAGTTLEQLIVSLTQVPLAERNGQKILDILDRMVTDPAALDLAALRDREALAGMDLVEAVCWMGARLAEALAHAHNLSVLHRDIKPANILVNRYGRPLLADFNIAAARLGDCEGEQIFGGTLGYMAPEHIDAFNPNDFTTADAVDRRSDIWSLGAVLYELLTGGHPYPLPCTDISTSDALEKMSTERRQPPPTLAPVVTVPPALERVLAHCMAPAPRDRYQDAADLAADLDSCRELHRVQRSLPPGYVVTPLVARRPFLVGAMLLLLPQFIGTGVNIAYNWARLVSRMNERQIDVFFWVMTIYDVLAYSILFALFVEQVLPVYQAWRRLQSNDRPDPAEIDAARRQALKLPTRAFILGSLGWFTGGVVFPLAIWLLAGPFEHPTVFVHFLFSFTISGLIAITYSVLSVQFVVVRVLYPGLWLDARRLREAAVEELGRQEGLVGLLQFFAVLIPLAGVALMLSPEAPDASAYATFRFLVTALLALGMVGLGLALVAGSELRKTGAVLIPARKKV
ncbi:MAG: serine/threonine-protein kinase [Gemmataceae bacterium]